MTMTFADLALAPDLLSALAEEGYVCPTPIQARSIPLLLEGRDLLGMAQTGTGKTASFALPLLHRLAEAPRSAPAGGARVLVLAPTRELVSQIADGFGNFGRYLKPEVTTIFGGVSQFHQINALRAGVDIIVATPGRLLDLIEQGHCDLSQLEALVLDEADQMLDMGFAKPIERIVATLPKDRHTLLFSATMPKSITALAESLLRDPAKVEIAPPSTTVDRIEQSVMFLDAADKKTALLAQLQMPGIGQAVVFTLQKNIANEVCAFLTGAGITAEALHGNRSQGQRERALNAFREGTVQVLVATDIAARGIDVDTVTHVFNHDLPSLPESYVHRIGRTGRAGRSGFAVTLCDAEQRAWLHDVEREIGRTLTVQTDHPWHSEEAQNSTMRAPVLGGGPAKKIKPPKIRERKVWTEEEKAAARAAAMAVKEEV
ncbi:DEAD/DEAH box helicase [Acetobacter oeni]|uniref:DEAD/DEAH box family ATP-dependent RNA helicase n=1 Tax=Acetobacter oeni TaxID=304077 RepID=A0A511XK67_9PROT|nr:DEAD/DEAH box helicase [Acetobacter oeni]MBB3883140.1 ATP-dependent RNA helicase RhlE [Acetobacter oeni]NHO19220.1 DEAD/DEAH box helicase [Acetobacter oeni]GBR05181.1 RNA helicase [Acetobacter oeni LMG 21952]GEN63321.1 DEAD/DEAH box family ATP-dependent RNA helicase [Acetobacter oeni]